MAKGENYNDIRAEAAIGPASSVTSSANESGTCEKIDTPLTQLRSAGVPRPAAIYRLDCALRNERDATRRMQLGLRMGMEREGSTPNYKARQDAILKPRYRVAAKMEVRL